MRLTPTSINIGLSKFGEDIKYQSKEIDGHKFFVNEKDGVINIIAPTGNNFPENSIGFMLSGSLNPKLVCTYAHTLNPGNKPMKIIMPMAYKEIGHYTALEINVSADKDVQINRFDSMSGILGRIFKSFYSLFTNDDKQIAEGLGIDQSKVKVKNINTGLQHDYHNCGRYALACVATKAFNMEMGGDDQLLLGHTLSSSQTKAELNEDILKPFQLAVAAPDVKKESSEILKYMVYDGDVRTITGSSASTPPVVRSDSIGR